MRGRDSKAKQPRQQERNQPQQQTPAPGVLDRLLALIVSERDGKQHSQQ